MRWYRYAVVLALAMSVTGFAQDFANLSAQRITAGQANLYGPAPLQIQGTNVTVSAAQINAAGGGTTATLTPTLVSNATLKVYASIVEVKTPKDIVDSMTFTMGNLTLTPTNAVITVEGHSGIITGRIYAAASTMPSTVEIWNLVATNIEWEGSTGLNIPTGYSVWTNGQYDGIKFRRIGTNWHCVATFDN